MWLWSRISALGRVTVVWRMFALPLGWVRIARNFGFCARLVALRPPSTLVASFGRNLSLRQAEVLKASTTGKALNADSVVGSEPPPRITPLVISFAQLVGLIVKLGLLVLTSIERMLSLAPPKTSGIGSDTGRIRAVSGSTKRATRTTTVPRSKGPAIAGVSTASESGAPL